MDKISKAVAGALASAYLAFKTAQFLETAGGVGITRNEWIDIALTAVITGFTVWAIPNTTTPTLK